MVWKFIVFTRVIHWGQGRLIKPGQLIHASVAFQKGYTPKADLPPEWGLKWHDILGKGEKEDLDWTNNLRHALELDLFDHHLKMEVNEGNIVELLKKLSRRALYGTLRFYFCVLLF
jgi:hypothetical protein